LALVELLPVIRFRDQVKMLVWIKSYKWSDCSCLDFRLHGKSMPFSLPVSQISW